MTRKWSEVRDSKMPPRWRLSFAARAIARRLLRLLPHLAVYAVLMSGAVSVVVVFFDWRPIYAVIAVIYSVAGFASGWWARDSAA